MSTLFISHSSADNDEAKKLQAALEEQGHRSVFLDLDPAAGIQAGVSWERTLYTKLRACRAVVALCSERYLASQWCFAEVALARMEGKELFVLQIDPWGKDTRMPSILTEEQFIDLRTNREDGYKRLWNGFKVKGIVPEEQREWGLDDPPYPGLRAFDETDAPIFFGREQEVRQGIELLNRVQRQAHPRLVMVLGSSGSGKSSLARAGLVPRLRRDGNRWLVVGPFRPGARPIDEVAAALSQAFDRAGEARSTEAILRRLTADAGATPGGDDATGAVTGQGSDAEPARRRLLRALRSLEGELTEADAGVARSLKRLEEFLTAAPAPGETPTPLPDETGAQPPDETAGHPSGESASAVARETVGPASATVLVDLADELRLLRGSSGASVLLVIDQFEELLGYEDEGTDHPANRFLAGLRAALEAEGSPLLALGTMRSDYLGMLQRAGPLQGLGFKSLSVGPMSPDGMRQVIAQPATLAGLEVEEGLPDLLLHDTGTPDALPLLAFTLRTMWDRYRDQRLLSVQGYRAFGGLEGAIREVADETLEAALEAGDESRLRDAFLSLARPAAGGGGWSRQPVRWDDLDKEVRPMLERFVDQRLLVQRADGTVEVAHEALFRSWPKLRGWLDENAEGLHLRSEIQADAARWSEAAEEERATYLWRGGRLARAFELRDRGVLPLEDVDRSFIEASDRAEREQAEQEAARRRMVLRGTLIFAAVLLVALAIATWQFFSARRARDDARWQALQATVGRLASQALNRLESQHDLALLLAAQATRMVPSGEAQSSLLRALQHNPRLEGLLHGHAKTVRSVAYGGPDGELLASGDDDGTILLWDVTRTEMVGTPFEGGHTGAVMSLTFSPKRKHLVSGGSDGTVRLWDVTEGVQLGLEQHGEVVRVVAFGPHGTMLASGDDGGTVLLWQVASGKLELQDPPLEGKLDSVRALAFHPDGQQLFAAGEGGIVRWRLGSSPPPGELLHEDWPNFLALSRDGRRLAWGGDDGEVRLWNLENGESPCSPEGGHSGAVWTGAFDSGGEILATGGSDQKVRLWTVDGCRESVPPLEGHQDVILGVAFDPDPPNGRRLASASKDATIRLWNLDTTQPLGRALPGRGARGRSLIDLAFSPDGKVLASVSMVLSAEDPDLVLGEITLWEMGGNGARLSDRQLEGPFATVDSMAFSPNSQRLAAGGGKAVGLWNVGTRRQLRSPEGQGSRVLGVSFIPEAEDGLRLLSIGSDRVIRSWNLAREDAPPGPFEVQADAMGTVARLGVPPALRPQFSLDGKLLAYGADDNTLRLWDVEASQQLEPALADLEGLSSLAFGPAGAVLASASSTQVLLWDAKALKALSPPLEAHGDVVTSAAFSLDTERGLRLASGSDDKTVRLWDVQTHRPLEPPFRGHEDKVRVLAFSSDGKRLASGDRSNQVMLWDVDLESWQDKACRVANRNFSLREWNQFMPQREYLCTCDSLPPDPETELATCP